MRKTLLIVLTLTLFGLVGCSTGPNNKADMKVYETVSKNHNYKTGDYEELTKALKNLETGYYLFGSQNAKGTQQLVGGFDKVMKDKKIESYFIDLESDEFTTHVQRRMDEFYIDHANETMLVNRWPSIIVVEDGIVTMFSLDGVSETLTKEEVGKLIETFLTESE